jgi:competence protein ComEA
MKKRKYSVLNYLSKSEISAVIFTLFLVLCGTILNLYGYTPPFTESQKLSEHQLSLNQLVATDYVRVYDLNSVSFDELLYIPNIGPATANAILTYQSENGFSMVDDLKNIRGIGERRLSEMREFFCVESESIATHTDTTETKTVIVIVDKPGSNHGTVDINIATKEQLMSLSGIGPVKAEAIIEYREKNGRFKKIEDIKKVKGIGEKTYDNIKDRITIGN